MISLTAVYGSLALFSHFTQEIDPCCFYFSCSVFELNIIFNNDFPSTIGTYYSKFTAFTHMQEAGKDSESTEKT